MKPVSVCLLLASAALAAGHDFAGRWGITALDPIQPRSWWLEIIPGDNPAGRFVGAPGGQMDQVRDVTVKDGRLRFTLRKGWRPRGEAEDGSFEARLVNGRLEGVFALADGTSLKWSGRRMPPIEDKDDGSWREGQPIHLFNGKDLSGWQAAGSPVVFQPAAPSDLAAWGWKAADGVLSTSGLGTALATRQKFWNFLLHVEFRVAPRGNSGVGLRGRYELQIADSAGRPVSGHSMGGVYGRILPTVNAAGKAGEWQSYDIRLVGRQVTVVLNGTKVIEKGEIEGPTAITIDPNEEEPGPICLQGDHGAVDFRNVVLTPLKR